jgi:Tfp pilus assembly protein PilX
MIVFLHSSCFTRDSMMKTIIQPDLNRQGGAATLLTALVLLIGITLVTLTTSKTVLVETQMAADNYRTAQAVAAANYAMDYGVNYFNNGGFDQVNNGTGAAGSDGVVDAITVPNLASADGLQTTTATLTFNNATTTRCAPTAVTMKNGLITATGFSDDGLASRTITQCVVPLGILRNDGPKQPLVAQGNVALTGNAKIINRYTNTTIWSGDDVSIGSSSSMATYIKNPAAGSLTQAQLLSTDETSNTQLVSNRNLGNGLDIIDKDPSLGTLVGLDFFKNFFNADSRAEVKAMAEDIGQSYTAMSNAITTPVKTGLIWVEGNQTMNGGTIGSLTDPAIVVVNGDLTLGGGATIYGVLYVAGKYTINGTPQVIGCNVVEGTDLSTGLQATAPIVGGTGTITLVFWQNIEGGSTKPPKGLTSVVGGSLRDW